MDLNFVYGARNKTAIKLRRLAYLSLRAVTRGAQKVLKEGASEINKVAVVLPFNATAEELGDVLNRSAWYWGDAHGAVQPSVDLFGPERLSNEVPEIPLAQRQYRRSREPVQVRSLFQLHPSEYDAVLLWRADTALDPRVWLTANKWQIGDPNIYSGSEHRNYMRVAKGFSGRKSDEELEQISKQNFHELLGRYRNMSGSVVLGTGPSLNELNLKSLKNKAVVVCNAIVKNIPLLEKIRPAAVCFADPVFHFGPSEYAATFRDDLVRAVQRFDCFAVTRRDTAELLLRHHPELADRLIGVEVRCDWMIPTEEILAVRATSNILTMLMLPIAAALSDEIQVAGCDGRKSDERYFWKHNSGAQYEGLMQTAFLTHPSFFRDRVYEDYYDEHCRMLEEQIVFYEARGRGIYSVSCSFIPALLNRQKMDSFNEKE